MGKEDTKVKNVTCFETKHNYGLINIVQLFYIDFQILIELFSELLA